MSTSTTSYEYYGLNNPDIAWWNASACNTPEGQRVNWFSNQPRDIAAAKVICGQCPVVERCLRHAEENDLVFFVFGGKTPEERR